MIPLRDENPSLTVPVATRALIVLNVIVFLYEVMLGPALRAFVLDWGMVPERLSLALHYGDEPLLAAALPVFSSMFLHGGWMHLIGNMWYLWIFGDNVEDQLGHVRFVLFYLAAGIFAALVHYLTNAHSQAPTVGASGAIAGVLGAYAVTFPRARVVTLVPLFPIFVQVMALPALLVLGLWFVLQFFSGALSLGGSGGGIAFWAHVGGFVFGAAAMRITRGVQGRSRARIEA